MSLKQILGGVRGVFLEDDAPPGQPVPAKAPVPAPVAQPAVPTPDEAETAQLDEKLKQQLLSSVYGAGVAAYKALDDTLETLEDVVPDINLRYKKALEILAKQGKTLPVILSDIDKAIGSLEEESRVFEADQKKHFQASVGALHTSVDTLKQQIQAKKAEVDRLNKEIEDMTRKCDADQASISTAQAEINHVQDRFTAVFQTIMREIQSQRSIVAARMGAV